MSPSRKRTKPTVDPVDVDVKIGFARDAKAAFDRLGPKAKAGIRRKLDEYGRNPALGKPLVGDLRSYHRLTYGRVRCVTRAADGLVLVLYCGLRKSDAVDDTYDVASALLSSNDPEIVLTLRAIAVADSRPWRRLIAKDLSPLRRH